MLLAEEMVQERFAHWVQRHCSESADLFLKQHFTIIKTSKPVGYVVAQLQTARFLYVTKNWRKATPKCWSSLRRFSVSPNSRYQCCVSVHTLLYLNLLFCVCTSSAFTLTSMEKFSVAYSTVNTQIVSTHNGQNATTVRLLYKRYPPS